MVTKPLSEDASPAMSLPRPAPFTPQCPGVLILTHAGGVAYMNPQAKELLTHLVGSPVASPSSIPLPPMLMSLCKSLRSKLTRSIRYRTWNDIQVQSVITTQTMAIVLRGLVLPVIEPTVNHRFLVLLEYVPLESHEPNASQTDRLPFLSQRQHAIVQGLMRGLTNKQLASELRLSPHTVKEYVRSLMLKVKATNRAGIVARLTGHPIGLPPSVSSAPIP